MKVGFLNNQLDNRGTGNALFDYAHYNEEILGNESVIFTQRYSSHDPLMQKRIEDRFGSWHYIDEAFKTDFNLDVLYHIKYGNDTLNSASLPNCRYVVHAVFDVTSPHGDRFATISDWLASQNKTQQIPVVPHIVQMKWPENRFERPFRTASNNNIPEDAVVFGRYGGFDSFDIPWVWDAIEDVSHKNPSIHFLFMNTNVPEWARRYPNIHVYAPTADPEVKAKFILSCDALLHARQRGETFGLTPAEFEWFGKPTIAYGLSPEKAHYEYGDIIPYFSQEGLVDILLNWKTIDGIRGKFRTIHQSYTNFSPYYVMKRFKEVFLD